jgi:hypothetical protein
MARYMLTENAFLSDGYFHEASIEKPLVISLPASEEPSLKWVPLDKEAEDTLDLLVEKYIEHHIQTIGKDKEHLFRREIKRKELPKGYAQAAALHAEPVKPLKRKDPQSEDQDTFDRMVEAATQPAKPAEVKVVPRGKRPSDTEPN